jgi:uncharacterized membrane protein
MADLWRFELICTRGKAALGEGNSQIGETLPALLAEAGLRDVALPVNDRAWPMLPPCGSPVERAFVEEAQDRAQRDIWFWDRVQTQRYFVAGGGRSEEFALLWAGAMAQGRRTVEAIEAGRYVCAGTCISSRKSV